MKRSDLVLSVRGGLAATLIALAAAGVAAEAAAARFLVAPTPRDALAVSILFLPEDDAALDAPLADGRRRIVVTGTYTGAEEPPRPVGFAIRGGRVTNPYPGGPDGLLLVDARGTASLHDVSDVFHDGRRFNLRRDPEAHAAFLARAEAEGLSAIQTHLLIKDGALDLREVPGARRCRRRLLFETASGDIGVFDTVDPMTLYEAAVALRAAAAPRMALNLDMGSYDYCEWREAERVTPCGLLRRGDIGILTNVIAIEAPAAAAETAQ
ncbi:MAG: hypothetical protein AAFR16_02540, partial [Pseudomonadota bacterium]